MGFGFAQTIVIGRLGKDPEFRYSPSGAGITQFSVASDRNYRKDGEWATDTEWYRVVVWDRGDLKTAQRAADTLHKGSLALVVGYMKTRDWEKDGIKRYATELIADKVTPLADYNKKGQDGETQVSPDEARRNVAAAREAFKDDIEDLPW